MALDYDRLMSLPPIETVHDLSVRDTMLYALSVGVGSEAPEDPNELQYVYEVGLRALPSMAVILAYPGFWPAEPRYGLNWQKILHGEQSIELLRPLPVSGRLRGVTTIDEIVDKGAEKGAILYSSRHIYLNDEKSPVAITRQSSFLRADGGFGGKASGRAGPRKMPDGAPHQVVSAATRPNQALLYRLSGDYNPLHADPAVAASGGFPRPILHGLAAYGVVCRELVRTLVGDEPARLKRMDVRFTRPVFPGDSLEISIWPEPAGGAAFEVCVPERGVVVQSNGHVEFED